MYNYYRRFRIRNGIETTLPQDRSFNIYYASFKSQEKILCNYSIQISLSVMESIER